MSCKQKLPPSQTKEEKEEQSREDNKRLNRSTKKQA